MKKTVKNNKKGEKSPSTEIIPDATSAKKTQQREIYWIIGTMISLILVFFIASEVFQSLSKVEYKGMTFVKEKVGNMTFYHYYFFPSNEAGVVNEYHLYLRTDPSKNDIPVSGGEIEFFTDIPVYLSSNLTALSECQLSAVSLGVLGSFLTYDFIKVKPAVLDESLSQQVNQSYITCADYPRRMVIEINKGNETSITKVNTNCYKLSFSDCEILPAVEKFQVQMIIDAKARSAKLKSPALLS